MSLPDVTKNIERGERVRVRVRVREGRIAKMEWNCSL